MAKKHDPEAQKAAETLEEIEGALDRVATWVTENPVPVLGTIGAVLLVAAVVGGGQALQRGSAEEASDALADAQADYLEAMGATPGTLDIVEPANPERARAIRDEYVERFLSVAEEHDGQAAAVIARLEAGALRAQLGDPEGALATLRDAAESGPGGELEAIARTRLAVALEEQSLPAEAAAEWAKAAQIEHPLQDLARAQAARLYLSTGDADQARSLAAAVEATDALPDYLKAAVSSAGGDATLQ